MKTFQTSSALIAAKIPDDAYFLSIDQFSLPKESLHVLFLDKKMVDGLLVYYSSRLISLQQHTITNRANNITERESKTVRLI